MVEMDYGGVCTAIQLEKTKSALYSRFWYDVDEHIVPSCQGWEFNSTLKGYNEPKSVTQC
jgi:hypothetical protein